MEFFILASMLIASVAVLFASEKAGAMIAYAFIALVFSLAVNQARADTVGIHIGSHHSKPGFNDTNPGAYYVHNSGATVGAYCNSESRSALFPNAKRCQVSAYAGYTVSTTAGPLNLSATVGVITGYARGTTPMILPTVSTVGTIGGIRPRLAFIPKVDPKRGAHVVHLMIEKEF